MNLLQEGIKQKAVIRTTLTRKVTLDGVTNPYPVYRIRLDWLFYNDQNDRIATWISQYEAQHDGQSPDMSDREAYNAIIEEFIVASNPDAIKKTQTNIEMVDQREPGVVLADGRIIDGNRRFTCLRRLADKSERFNYFEAVIIDRDIEHSAKQIKMLELEIQHGEESKVSYNPVDRLVGVYRDVVENRLLTVEEYARSCNETESEVRQRIDIAKLMVEFLEFINAPGQFHVARDLQVYFPLEELSKMIRKCRPEDAEDLKIVVFNNILMQPATDMTRFIRNIKAVIGSDYQAEFLNDQREAAAQVLDTLPPVGKMDTACIRDVVRTNDEVVQVLRNTMEKALSRVKKKDTMNRPIQLAEKATNFLEDIDVNIIRKMNDSELRRLERQLDKLQERLMQIREIL